MESENAILIDLPAGGLYEKAIRFTKSIRKYHSPTEFVFHTDLQSDPRLQPFLLHHQTKLGMLCCTACRVVLTNTSGLIHIRSTHATLYEKMSKTRYQEICAELEIRDDYPPVEDLNGMCAISGLDMFTMALVCGVEGCGKVFSTGNSMRTHYGLEHNIQGIRIPTQFNLTRAQHLDNNHHKEFFRVNPLPSHPNLVVNPDWIAQLDADIEQTMLEVALNASDPRSVNALLKKTKWLEHVEDLDAAELRSLVAAPTEEEFPMLGKVMVWIIKVAWHFARFAPDTMLQRLNKKDKTPVHTPWGPLESKSSIQNYAQVLTRFVAFLLREKKNYTLPLPEHIVNLITDLKEIPPPSPQLPPPTLRFVSDKYVLKVVEILMSVWTHIWDPSDDNILGDPNICFVALTSIRADGGWATAVEITPLIARLIYGLRTVFLFNIFSDRPEPAIARKRHGELEQWCREGEYSPFSSLYSLQHLATTIVLSTPSFPAFIWYNILKSSFIWRGSLITLSAFRNMGQFLLQCVYDRFEKVMLGTDMQVLGYIADDLTNTTPDYGFMNDSRNQKIYNRRTFLDLIMASSKLRGEFFIAMAPDGTPLLNLSRLRKRLHNYSEALLYLMAAVEVLAGSPSRGTELTCTQLRNTACRTRGLYTIGAHLAIVSQYSKTSAMKGKDTLIPHVLDAFCQEMMKIVAFRTHPFAEQVISILFPGQISLLSLWRNYLFVNFDHLFTTDDISSVLRVASLKTIEVAVGVRDYRQMSVCVRRAHCPMLEELVGLGDEEDAAVLQAGHTSATEQRCYGVSTGYLGNLPENLVEPYAKASTEWQILMCVPEGGKHIRLSDFPSKNLWKQYLSPAKPTHKCCSCVRQSVPDNVIDPLCDPESVQSFEDSTRCTSIAAGPEQVGQYIEVPDTPLPVASDPISLSCTPLPKTPHMPHRDQDAIETPSPPTKSVLPHGGVSLTNANHRKDLSYTEWIDRCNSTASVSNPPSNAELWSQLVGNISADQLREMIKLTVQHNNNVDAPLAIKTPIDMEQTALDTLRRLIKSPDCNWTSSEQCRAAMLAIEGQRDMLIALPTGSGKSIIPILAAELTHKTFVVVVPLISLLEDWERRLKHAKMQYSIFKHNMHAFDDYPIILATTDIAVTDKFAHAIGYTHAKKTLGGLVLDEVHEVFVSSDFRACMRNIWKIRRLPFPIISMSGTVPVSMEKPLIAELGLQDNTTIIRRSSNRPELLYHVDPHLDNPTAMGNRIQQIIEEQNLQPMERGLVFVTSIADGDGLATHLGCEFYHGDNHQFGSRGKILGADTYNGVGANSHRKAMVDRWRTGIQQVLVATTAFALGNDFPHVRVVILARTPFDMSSAIQEMGRAGRDGKPASCYIIPSTEWPRPLGKDSLDFKGREAMTKMIWKSRGCIRLSLTRYVDGDDAVSCRDDPTNMICSRCRLNEQDATVLSSSLGSSIHLHSAAEDWSTSRKHSTKTPGLVPNLSLAKSTYLPTKRHGEQHAPFEKEVQLAKRRRVDAQLATEEYVERLKQVMIALDGMCTVCMVQQPTDKGPHSHLANYCPRMDFHKFVSWKRNIRYKMDLHGPTCTCCHLPQIDDSLHKRISAGTMAKTECPYPDRTLPLVFAVYHNETTHQAAESFFKVHWPTDIQYALWLCAPPECMNQTNTMRVVLWFIETYWFR